MNRSPAADTDAQHEDRSRFEQFVEAIHRKVSQPPFFFVCIGVVVVWFASVPLWTDLKQWQAAIHTVSSVLSLLLLVLLENSGRRSGEATQEKLNVIAEALADLMESRAQEDSKLTDAVARLRDSVGLEERH